MKKTMILLAASIALVAGGIVQAEAESQAEPQAESQTQSLPQVVPWSLDTAGPGSAAAHRFRVSALVNDSLSPKELARIGWRVVTRTGEVATLEGPAATLARLGAVTGILYVKMPSRVFALMDSVRKVVHADELHGTRPGWTGPRLTGRGVLFGLIDTDFDTRHKAFIDTATGLTRFIALWDQGDTTPGFPNRFGYGVIKNRQGVLADSLFCLGSDGHGTLMASFGAGSDWRSPYYGIAPDVMIAGVKMGGEDQDIIDGISWLFSLADSLRVPCVVNMSLGAPTGPHDGTSLVDRAIDNATAVPGHIIVGASGNDGSRSGHVTLTVGSGQSQGAWLTPVPIASPYYLSGAELWGDSGKNIIATLYVLDTGTMGFGLPTPRISVNSNTAGVNPGLVPITWNGHSCYYQITEVNRISPLNGKPHIQVYLVSPDPTVYFGVSVSVSGTTGGTVQAWNIAQRSFRSFGIAGYNNGDATMSVNELGGTAKRNITAGAYVSKSIHTLWNGTVVGGDDLGFHALTHYTGRGPTVDGRVKPDITAPGSNIAGAMPRFFTDLNNCVFWPDSPAVNGRYMVNGGTSVSSAVVAGVVALMLEADSSLTTEQARTILQETAITDSATGTIPPYNNMWGAGKVNAMGALARVLGITSARRPAPAYVQAPAAPKYRLTRLNGSRLCISGPAVQVKIDGQRFVFEYFSISGRCCMRHVLDRGTFVDSFGGLPHGVYLVRVAAGNSVMVCRARITVVDKK